ncbi:MAG: helix-turn-helix domain-containing protein [Pseudomonadota bacterium]
MSLPAKNRKNSRETQSPKPRIVSLSPSKTAITRRVAKFYGFRNLDALYSSSRKPKFAHPRQVAMKIMRDVLGASYPDIGAHFGKDHTTAMHGVRVVEKRLLEDEDFAVEFVAVSAEASRKATRFVVSHDQVREGVL